jgi:hypothetical protein
MADVIVDYIYRECGVMIYHTRHIVLDDVDMQVWRRNFAVSI